jgi:hypothetical protein
MGKIEGLKSIKSSQGKAYETYALQMWGEEWRREDGKVRGGEDFLQSHNIEL